jgi:CRISPR-associated protein Csy1
MEKVYSDFLKERKRLWLDKKISSEIKNKKDSTDEKIHAIRDKYLPEADQRYDYSTWFLKAVKEARPYITSHPSTFTHPDAKTTAILFKGDYTLDGYLKSGNVDINQKFDVFGNAATNAVVLDTFIFLTSKGENGQSIIESFREKTKSSEQFVASFNLDYADVVSRFHKMFVIPEKLVTNKLVKQIYFPLSESGDYHLLSLLPSSPLTFEQKSRIDVIKFSKSAETARANKKQNLYDEHGFDELFNLTVLGYGGAHPENISVLAIQNRGISYLLQSIPPVLEKRHIRLPRYDFFKNSLWLREYKESFQSLHKLAMTSVNNVNIRQAIENIIKYIVD